MERAQEDFAEISTIQGMDEVLTKSAAILGANASNFARHTFGEAFRTMRIDGRMTMLPSSGELIQGSTKPVPQHVFHGPR